MPRKRARPAARRRPLSRERVLRAALALADRDGIEALAMRTLAHELGAEPMSLYRHVRNKADLLDGLVDLVFAEIELPPAGGAWKPAMRRRALSARAVLARHRWAIALMESRSTPGPANLTHHDAVLGTLIASGFSGPMATRAYNLINSYIYGFVLQETSLPIGKTPQELGELADAMLRQFASGAYPHLAAVARELAATGFVYADEFEIGLDLILNAITPRGRRSS